MFLNASHLEGQVEEVIAADRAIVGVVRAAAARVVEVIVMSAAANLHKN